MKRRNKLIRRKGIEYRNLILLCFIIIVGIFSSISVQVVAEGSDSTQQKIVTKDDLEKLSRISLIKFLEDFKRDDSSQGEEHLEPAEIQDLFYFSRAIRDREPINAHLNEIGPNSGKSLQEIIENALELLRKRGNGGEGGRISIESEVDRENKKFRKIRTRSGATSLSELPSCDIKSSSRVFPLATTSEPSIIFSPTDNIEQGQDVTVTISNINPNSDIFLDLKDEEGQNVLTNYKIGRTDDAGTSKINFDSTYWKLGSYRATISVKEGSLDDITFTVEGKERKCTIIPFTLMFPSGQIEAEVKDTESPCDTNPCITLSWPQIGKANSYTVTLDDDSGFNFDDEIFKTCKKNEGLYYCETGIEGTAISDVPVEFETDYTFSVIPQIKACKDMSLITYFTVTAVKGSIDIIVIDDDTSDKLNNAKVDAYKIKPDVKTLEKTKFTESDGSANFDELEVGDYEFTATEDDHIAKSLSTNIKSGNNAPITIELEKKKGQAKITVVDTLDDGDSSNDVPISGAVVHVVDTNQILVRGSPKSTGDNGVVEFSDLPVGSYTVTATATGYIEGPDSFELKGEQLEVDIQIQLSKDVVKTGSITIKVIGIGNEPLQSAKVSLDLDSSSKIVHVSYLTNEVGEVEFPNLPVGDYQLSVEKDGYDDYVSSNNILIIEGSNSIAPITLIAKVPIFSISPQLFTQGVAIVTTTVTQAEVSYDIFLNINKLSGNKGFTNIVDSYLGKTDVSGNFSDEETGIDEDSNIWNGWNDLPVGQFEAWVVVADIPSGKVGFIVEEATGSITITVVDEETEEEEIVTNAELAVYRDSEEQSINPASASGGVFIFKDVPIGDYTAVASAYGYRDYTDTITIVKDTTGNKVIELQKLKGSVTINVFDIVGNSLSESDGATVTVVNSNGAWIEGSPKNADSSGKVVFENLPIGPYRAYASGTNYYLHEMPFSIKPDNLFVDLTINLVPSTEPTGSKSITVSQQINNAEVSLNILEDLNDEQDYIYTTIGYTTNGDVLFSNLPLGYYTVTAKNSNNEVTALTIAEVLDAVSGTELIGLDSARGSALIKVDDVPDTSLSSVNIHFQRNYVDSGSIWHPDVNGVVIFEGLTPFTKEEELYKYTVVVKANGYNDYSTNFRIEPEALFFYGVATLVELAKPTGSITISVTDKSTGQALIGAWASITNNGDDFETSDYTDGFGSVIFSDIPLGSYTATVTADGYISDTINFDIAQGVNTPQPILLDEAKGLIQITVIDENSKNPVDGAMVEIIEVVTGEPIKSGLTNREGIISFTDLPVGDHKASVTKLGYSNSIPITFVIEAGDNCGLTVELKPKIPALDIPLSIIQGEEVSITVTNAEKNSDITWHAVKIEVVDGDIKTSGGKNFFSMGILKIKNYAKSFINSVGISSESSEVPAINEEPFADGVEEKTGSNGGWPTSPATYSTSGWPVGEFEAWVEVAGISSSKVSFNVYELVNQAPPPTTPMPEESRVTLSIIPTTIIPGETIVNIEVTKAKPNSDIKSYILNTDTEEYLVNGEVMVTKTDSEGKWSKTEEDTSDWDVGSYLAWVEVDEIKSNEVEYEVTLGDKISAESNREFEGVLEVIHIDDFVNPENAKFEHYLRIGKERFELKYDMILPVLISGTKVKVRGQLLERKIFVDTKTPKPFEILSTPSIAEDNIGLQSTLVIVASIGSLEPSAGVSHANIIVFGEDEGDANDYYIKNSFNKVFLTGKVVGPYSLPDTVCTRYDMLTEAIKAADQDVYFPDYTRIILDVPSTKCTAMNAAGEATIGKISISTPDGDIVASVSLIYYFNPLVVGHELGHNFGLDHAGRMDCMACDSYEFEGYDIMSNWNTYHLNAPHKEQAGWLENENVLITTSGEYLLKPLEIQQTEGQIQQIKLPLKVKPSSPSFKFADNVFNNLDVYYNLEFRQPIDYDKGLNELAYSGISMHLSSEPPSQTHLIDYDDNLAPLLQIGQTFRDSVNDYEITLKSVDSMGALVKIGRFEGTNNPPIGELEGIEESFDNYIATGWALDPDTPNNPIYVVFYIDRPTDNGGEYIGYIKANDFTEVNGDHGFSFTIGPEYRGKENRIHAYAVDSWNGPLLELESSP